MTDAAARQLFDAAYDNATDADAKAKLEVLREYLFNTEFRDNLRDFMFDRVKAL